ncbi:2-hydroxyglutaryl-CoA dehydratase [Myxococcota bacterium]|nr:2-hydroxyglutaryl-CoA dehydratase [Myxococcota bacterium]MBU1380312.1 2-hydroxyglutaryl-CoA dehydratase [Myxococcota bacterium]MBU1495300.1 2-hydroxyglutaryl-CoA dehydratase [Myxococcota bacterium]
MIFCGIDIGSNTSKAVLLKNNHIISTALISGISNPSASAEKVFSAVLEKRDLKRHDISCVCATGYGRYEIIIADINKSEISCHGAGAFFSNSTIRTIIDIGGQDCKIICVDERGFVDDFVMNDKCAAGTGRSLEIMAQTLGLSVSELGYIAMKSSKSLPVSNKCSIFMELDVMQHLLNGEKTAQIARGITITTARRIAQLAGKLELRNNICISGGVSKNPAVCRDIQDILKLKLTKLNHDPQLMGAIGAAIFARNKEIVS